MAEVLDLLGDNIMDDINHKNDDGDEEFWVAFNILEIL